MKRLLLALLLAGSVQASSTSVFSIISDTWNNVDSDSASNYGSADTIKVRYVSTGPLYMNSFVKPADVRDTIPPTGVAVACTLYLYQSSTVSRTLKVERCLKPWVEDQLSYYRWKNSNEWGTAAGVNTNATGCADAHNTSDGSGYDKEGTQTSFTTGTGAGWKAVPIDTCHINDWITSRDSCNGFVLFTETNLALMTFYSSEHGSYPPYMKVVWDLPATGPPNYRHGPAGTALRHSTAGGSVRHKP